MLVVDVRGGWQFARKPALGNSFVCTLVNVLVLRGKPPPAQVAVSDDDPEKLWWRQIQCGGTGEDTYLPSWFFCGGNSSSSEGAPTNLLIGTDLSVGVPVCQGKTVWRARGF